MHTHTPLPPPHTHQFYHQQKEKSYHILLSEFTTKVSEKFYTVETNLTI